MQWRKEPNNYTNASFRFALTYQQREIYHCLKEQAGRNDNLDREGYVERSKGIPYTTEQLSVLIGEDAGAVQSTLDILVEHKIVEISPEGCILFLNWIPIDKGKVKRTQTPTEREYFDRGNQERLNRIYPDGMDKDVEKRIIQLINEGKLKPLEEVE